MGHSLRLTLATLTILICAAASHAQQTVFVPFCSGVNDTAKFTALATSLGSIVPATIRLPSRKTCKLTTNVVLTSNITLDGTDGGMVDLTNSSVTLTLQGPLNLPARKVFLNATAGLGTVSFAGNNVQKDLHVAWWGADAATAGAATNTAIDAALASLSTISGGSLHFSRAVTYQVTGLTWTRCFTGSLIGIDSGVGPIVNGSAPAIVYVGTNGGTILHGVNLYKCMIKGIRFIGSLAGGSSGADIGIHLDQVSSGSPPISTNDLITANVIIPGSSRSGWIGVKVDNVDGTNNEQHFITHNDLTGSSLGFGAQVGVGIYLGHGNVKEVNIKHNVLAGLATGIKGAGNPSFYSEGNNFTSTAVPFSGPFGDAVTSLDDHGEDGTQILVASGGIPFTMIGARFSNLHGGQTASGTTSIAPIFDPGPNALLEIRGSIFQPISGTFTSDFILGAASSARLTWKRNTVTGISRADLIAGLNTFVNRESDVGGGVEIRGAFVAVGVQPSLFGTTPSLTNYPYSIRYGFAQPGVTSVTNFINGLDGQIIILVGDTFTTLVNGATIKTISGANIGPWTNSKVVMLYNDAGVWRQIGGVQ